MKINKELLAILTGALTLILFASKPYLLEILYPSKSVGQLIGENAKDLLDGFKGKEKELINSGEDKWRISLNIIGFMLFAITLILSISLLKIKEKKKYGQLALFLAFIGLAFYFSYLALGLIVFLAIGVLAIIFLNYFVSN